MARLEIRIPATVTDPDGSSREVDLVVPVMGDLGAGGIGVVNLTLTPDTQATRIEPRQ